MMKITTPLLQTMAAFCGIVLLNACIPPAPPYPHEPPAKVLAGGQQLSDSLDAYIRRWMAGTTPAQVPAKLIPEGITDCKDYFLMRPEDVKDGDVWAVRYAKPVNTDSALNGLPDPNVTYLLLAPSLAPFGSKLVMEGEFPHCRFFSVQITHPLDGKNYTATRYFGSAEVSIADADIEPLPGNVNPFRPGAGRNAANRKYRLEIDLAKGDAVALNKGAFAPPYRGVTRRAGSLIVYQGPWGEKDFFGKPKPGGGKWNVGNLWIRIYAPDKGKGPLGGVAMPKLWYELPDGRKYFLAANCQTLLERAHATMQARTTNEAPNPNYSPEVGWFKSWGIVRSILNGAAIANGWDRMANFSKINAVDLGVTGRGEQQPAPGNYEPHATTNNYATYLGRTVTLQKGQVAVLVGKMPEHPLTRNGQATMQTGQVRYWSICGYDNNPLAKLPGSCINGIMDEEVTLDKNRFYIIAYSRTADRPRNATAAGGITWVPWGPTAELGLMMRWVTVGPEWDFDLSPHEQHLTWAKSDWTGSAYDSTLIGLNHHNGFMQCYLPRIRVMSKTEFEALGNNLRPEQIPVWIDKTNKPGISEAQSRTATASTVWNNEYKYTASMAFDGNLKTRWSSSAGDRNAFLMVDLGSIKSISGVKLFWEFAAARKYTIDVSADGQQWSTIYTQNSGNGGIDVLNKLQGKGRYVRMSAAKGVLGWYSLYEMEVLSADIPCLDAAGNTPPPAPPPQALQIWPNPATGQVVIAGQPVGMPQALNIYNAAGNLVYRQPVTGSRHQLNIAGWQSGAYTVRWRNPAGMLSGRLVKL